MRADRIAAGGFRNLVDLDLALPPAGAVLLGPNAHGKTSVLEALYYPVLYRSFRGAADAEVTQWGEPGFQLALGGDIAGRPWDVRVGFVREGRRKRVTVDGLERERLADAVGQWLAVAFLPTDLALLEGPAGERRRYLDRVLALANPGYLRALLRYRAGLSQRNAALRGGRAGVAWAFGTRLAESGAEVIRHRLAWVEAQRDRFEEDCLALGEARPVTLRYRGTAELAEAGAWAELLARAADRELARGMTLVGPHRDDLVIEQEGRVLRDVGSTGQLRTAAVSLKLAELATLREASGREPVLLLDDVFAELDRERQERLSVRLAGPGVRQVFLTAARRDELPEGLALDVFEVRDGALRPAAVPV
ncbi:MAG: DNA replication and repair protein RecF [Gemmatimonadota bacterium]